MTASYGFQSQLVMDNAGIDAASDRYEFLKTDLRCITEIIDNGSEANRNTRARNAARTRLGRKIVRGSIQMQPNPPELDTLLPRIMGASESSDVFAFAEALPSFYTAIDHEARVHTYSGCVVSEALFWGRENGAVNLKLSIIGKDEDEGASGSLAEIDLDDTYGPYVFADGAITLDDTTRNFKNFALLIRHYLKVRYYNSRTATCIAPVDREVLLRVGSPYTSSESDIYTDNKDSITGDTASLVLTNSVASKSLTFSFANVKLHPESPTVDGKAEEIGLDLSYSCYESGGTKELIITSTS